jgi:hypothetical protein
VIPRTCRRGRDVQLKIEDGELRLHHSNDGIESGYFFSYTVDNVLQPETEFNIAGSESVQVVSGATIQNGTRYRLAVKVIRKLNPGGVR